MLAIVRLHWTVVASSILGFHYKLNLFFEYLPCYFSALSRTLYGDGNENVISKYKFTLL